MKPYRESESHLGRQSGLPEYSLTKFDVAKKPSIRGVSSTNLRTTRPRLRPEILSVSPFLSKPPDCADLVRFL